MSDRISTWAAFIGQERSTAKARAVMEATRYIRDVQAGLTPSDALFDPIYDTISAHGGLPLIHRTQDQLLSMAMAIGKVRMES